MTLEEAIKTYTSNAEYERIHGNLQGCLDFRQLAGWLRDYKRLKEQQPSEDAISRQAAIALTKVINVPTGNAYVYYTHKCIDPQDIIELPHVSVAEKVGEWIYDDKRSDWDYASYHCSCCGRNESVPAEIVISEEYPYCHCGAKMVEQQESEDKG